MQEASDLAAHVALVLAVLWKPFGVGVVMLLVGRAIPEPTGRKVAVRQPDDGHYYNVMPRWLSN
jgi:hypothetical protein